MKITGLITEYNPFHNGHLYHLNKSRELTDADYTIVVMSGNFLQRGTPAVINKYERTKMALVAGADLVLELPVHYACASAEFFAYGGVSLLHNLGCVDHLVFGSEATDLSPLESAASMLLSESVQFQSSLKNHLGQGFSFPQARSRALAECIPDCSFQYLSSPNNILGIEYLKALKRLHSPIQAHALPRQGQGYHELSFDTAAGFASASGIRHALEQGYSLDDLLHLIPADVLEILKNASGKCFPITESDFSALVHYKLLLSEGSFDSFADITPDLAIRMRRLLPNYQNLNTFTDLLKSRNYTRTRISRCLMHVLLEMHDLELQPVPYARILGFRKASSPLLTKLRENARIPLITKVADAKNILGDWYLENISLSNYAQTSMEKDLFAANIYEAAASEKFHTKAINEYTHGLILY